ncbi:hypothetical protein OJAV_G00047060 [Oryzias javanicus]|uniref:TNFR-Cys domain-containing protein n=1 Tax=Oryzias javanicus TaxID=123683 RepID=A0A437DF12_ORYJA|nr:hypothetical protein OJAV_G00047060 [Oryzias javanicus]
MVSLKMFMVFLTLSLLGIWMMVGATRCPKNTFWNEHLCCDSCPPGTHLENFCSNSQKTICKPCKDGYYADKYNVFDFCKQCQSCQQVFSQNCTPTTNRKCACLPGFLCSSSDCSVCEKNNCTKDENLIKTVISKDESGLEKYSYHCEPKRPKYDSSDNKYKNDTKRTPTDRKPDPQSYHHHTFVIMCTGFVLVAITLVAFVFYTWSRERRKPIPNHAAVQAPTAKTGDFHLSKEESGLQLITQSDSTESSRFDSCDSKEVSALSV